MNKEEGQENGEKMTGCVVKCSKQKLWEVFFFLT